MFQIKLTLFQGRHLMVVTNLVYVVMYFRDFTVTFVLSNYYYQFFELTIL